VLLLLLAIALPVARMGLTASSVRIGITPTPPSQVVLAPCDASGLFPDDPNDPEAFAWNAIYRATVSRILDGELADGKHIDCDGSRSEAADRILETLDAYGCALKAKGLVLQRDLRIAAQRNGETTTFDEETRKTLEFFERSERNLAIARASTQRALLILLGKQKFDPLERAFICLNRASKDLRNILGLLAEAASCLPLRTWDTRTTLRALDVPQPPAGSSSSAAAQ